MFQSYSDGDVLDSIPALELGLVSFLARMNVNMPVSVLRDEFARRRTTVLLDGVDEAIKIARWICFSVADFARRNPDVQVVISSRVSGAYIDEIPFVGVTLLPLNETQRDQFVDSWFGDVKSSSAAQIKSHLKARSELDQIARNPLLLTVLCVLEDAGVPLPDSELRLYEDRMRLLLGHYDYKQIRRFSCSRHDLEVAARKLAFYLHSRGARSANVEGLVTALLHSSLDLKESYLRQIVGELVDPGNVLVPMNEDGSLGFGHLRYQEYLCAVELSQNRSADVVPLLAQSWWRDALIIFARLSSDLEWLVRSLARARGIGEAAWSTVIAMIEAGPAGKRTHLANLARQFAGADYDDAAGFDVDYARRDFIDE